MTGVTLSASQARFVRQAWHLATKSMDADGVLHDRRDTFSISGSICVAGVTLSVPA